MEDSLVGPLIRFYTKLDESGAESWTERFVAGLDILRKDGLATTEAEATAMFDAIEEGAVEAGDAVIRIQEAFEKGLFIQRSTNNPSDFNTGGEGGGNNPAAVAERGMEKLLLLMAEVEADWTDRVFNMGAVTLDTLGSAFQGVGQEVANLWDGTSDWGSMTLSLLKQVTAQVIQMVLQYTVGAVAIKAMQSLFGGKSEADAAQEGAAITAAYAPAATMASIATGGSAALIGVAALLAGLAVGVAAGQAAEGTIVRGPGTGTSDSVPYWLSNGESVLTAAATSAIGEGPIMQANAEANAGRANNLSLGGRELNVAFYENRRHLGMRMREGNAVDAIIEVSSSRADLIYRR